MPGATLLKLAPPGAAPTTANTTSSTTSNRPTPLQLNTLTGNKRPHSLVDSPATASPTSQTFKRPRAVGPSLTTPTMPSIRKTSFQQATPTSAHPLRQSSLPGDPPIPAMSPRSVSFNHSSKMNGNANRQYSPSVASTTGTRKTTGTTATNPTSRKRKAGPASSTKSGPTSTLASQTSGINKKRTASRAKKTVSSTGRASTARRSIVAPSISRQERTSSPAAHGPDADDASLLASDSDLSADEALDPTSSTAAQSREQENQQAALRFLIEKFSQDQNDRYDVFNRYSLPKPIVKRLANATVSQSLPSGIITALRSMAKTFLGELVEQSVEVQREWLAAREAGFLAGKEPELRGRDRAPVFEDTAEGGRKVLVDETRPPLLPDHVREALRRWKGRTRGMRTGGSLAGNLTPGLASGVMGGRIGRARLR